VELNITGGTIQEVATQMWAGSLDLALVVLPLNSPALEKIVLCEESFVVAIPARHPLAKKQRLQISDFAADRFILHRQGQNTRKIVDRYLFREHITPRVAIELTETEAIKAMVARGLGVSVLPESAFLGARNSGEIRTFPIAHKDLHRSLAVVFPRPKAVRPAVSALIELLKSHFRRMPRLPGMVRS